MPPSPPPPLLPPEHYATLISALSPSPPIILDLDILPSSYPSRLHIAPPNALAVPKPLLVSLFLHARHTFFAHLTAPSDASYDGALAATLVLLFWEPNHATAANFRKRRLLSLRDHARNDAGGGRGREGVHGGVERELCFVSSLLTAPLTRHAKSSTLWSHRFWVVTTFLGYIMSLGENDDDASRERALSEFWQQELAVVTKAGERHPRNYYAFDYARRLCRFLTSTLPAAQAPTQAPVPGIRVAELARASVEPVKKWCLAHPRDVSGWAFLAFLLQRAGDGGGRAEDADGIGSSRPRGDVAGMGESEQSKKVCEEVSEWTNKFAWRGESVEWFLRALDR